MGARERGFTLLELAVALGVLVLLLAAGAWTLSLHPNALAAATNDLDATLASARAIAASSGNGATIVFAPRTGARGQPISGFVLSLYRGRPDAAGAVSPANTTPVLSDAQIRERTLGSPPFAIFIDSAGNASGQARYPALDERGIATFAVIAREPPCPNGGFVLTLANVQNTASQARTLPCRGSLSALAAPNASPTPNVPIVTPSALLFHWPGDAEQEFVATEWGYAHWFAASDGFQCGSDVAAFPNVLPSPYGAAPSPSEAGAPPSPPPGVPYSYPNSGGESTNDAPAVFPLQPQSPGLCNANVHDAFGQKTAAAVAVMGWLTATYGSTIATHGAGTIAIPASALPGRGSSVTISLAKSFDAAALAPRVAFTGNDADACAADLAVSSESGFTPASPSTTPATASLSLAVVALPPATLRCGGIIYNHYFDRQAPADDVSEAGEGIAFTTTLGPVTGALSSLGKIVFWLPSGSGGACSYAQLSLRNGSVDANAPNATDAFNHTDANGCVTNGAVNLWANEPHYAGAFSVALATCLSSVAASATQWNPSGSVRLSSLSATPACSLQVESSDQTIANGGAATVAATVNACQGTSFSVGIGTGCTFTMPVSWGDPPDCTPGGSGGEVVNVAVTENPDPMLGTLAELSSDGVTATYVWTRTAAGTQTISYVAVETLCKHTTTSHATYTMN